MEYNKNTPANTTLVSSLPKEIRDKGESLKELIDGVENDLQTLNSNTVKTIDFDTHKAENVTQGDNPHGVIYEKGTWTPRFRTTGYTYAVQDGIYVRQNDVVTCYARIEITENNVTLVDLHHRILDLPFVAKKSAPATIGRLVNVNFRNGNVLARINPTTRSELSFYSSQSQGNELVITVREHVGNNHKVDISITYEI